MGEQSQKPPESSLHPIKERDGSPNSESSSDTLRQSPESSSDQSSQQKSHRPQLGALQNGLSTPQQEQPQTPLSPRNAMNRQPTVSGSFYYASQNPPTPATERRLASQNRVQQTPSHSVAGPGMMDQPAQGPVYQDPEYQSMNPKYGKNNQKPVWGLAKPLPRVVRPGMRRDQTTQQQAYETKARGEAEPAPELGTTPGLAKSHSNATNNTSNTAVPQHPPTYASAAQQDLPQNNAVYGTQPDGLLRPMESEVGGMSGPIHEDQMGEPEQEEFLNTWVKIRNYMKEPFAEWLAVSRHLPMMNDIH